MCITDADFGRAYLTDAWATRFIASMFSRFVVVFVGYSYNDVVMSYLSRGLPPTAQRPRYAFSVNDEESLRKWSHLSIKPLLYSTTDAANPHEAITDSVSKLVEILNSGLLGQAQRIQSILQSSPPLEGEDSDFLKFSLSKSDTAQIFFRHARSRDVEVTQWLNWLEKHEVLKSLFNPKAELDDAALQLSRWLADLFVAEHSQELQQH